MSFRDKEVPSTVSTSGSGGRWVAMFTVTRAEYAAALKQKAAWQTKEAEKLRTKIDKINDLAKAGIEAVDDEPGQIGMSTAYQMKETVSRRCALERELREHESAARTCTFAMEHINADQLSLTQYELAHLLNETQPLW